MSGTLAQTIESFCDAFNRNDLDAVMSYFADDGVYTTLEGKRCEGRAAIRAEFEPQFQGAFGRMKFITEDTLVDERAGKVVLRWWCEHQLEGARSLRALLAKLVYGRVLRWQGLDVFTLREGKILEKHTFTRARTPLLVRGGVR